MEGGVEVDCQSAVQGEGGGEVARGGCGGEGGGVQGKCVCEVRGPEGSVTTAAAAAAAGVVRRRSPLHHERHERVLQRRRGSRAPLQERRHVHVPPEQSEVGGHARRDAGVHVAVEGIDVGVHCAEERGQSALDLVLARARGKDGCQCIAGWWYWFARGCDCSDAHVRIRCCVLCCGGFLQHAQLRGGVGVEGGG